MAKETGSFDRVQEILPRMIRSLGMGHKYKTQMIFFYWDQIVGEGIAAKAVPAKVSFGTLFLTAKNSVWANNLLLMKLDLLEKINAFLGEKIIKDIRFKGTSWENEETEEETAEQPEEKSLDIRKIPLSAQERAAARDICSSIEDPELRKRLERLYEKDLKRRKYTAEKGYHPCRICGVLCPPEESCCNACSRMEREQTEAKIREILAAMPWARYADVHKYIPCKPEMVHQQRIRLIQRYARGINPEKTDTLEAKTLVMLYRCIPPEQLTDELITKTLHRLRNDCRFFVPMGVQAGKYIKKEKKRS